MDRLEQLAEFLEKEPNDPFLQYAMAIEYIGKDNKAKGKEILLHLKEKHPNYTALYYHLGKLYQQEGDSETAEKIYREGIVLTMKSKEQHTLAELQSALNNMLFEE